MNVQYEQQGDYLIPCIRTKEQTVSFIIMFWRNTFSK